MKKNLKFIIPMVLIVFIIAIVAIYFLTDLFKSPKKLFYKYIGKTFQTEQNYTYNDLLEDLNFHYENTYETNAEVTLDAKLDNSDVDSINELKNLKLSLLSQVSPKQKESYSRINLDYKNDNLTSIEYLNSNNNYGIKCSDIYKDYFYIENKNLKSLAEKLGIDSTTIPDSISQINIYDLLYISKDNQKSILDKYYKVIDSELDKDNFSSDKGVDVKVNGKTIKTDSYTLTLTSKDIKNILTEVCKTLKNDDKTLDLFLEKYKMLTNNIDDVELSKEDIKSILDESIDSLADFDTSVSGKVRITVYESKGKTVKLTIKSGTEIIGLDLTENKKDGIINLYVESNDEIVFNINNEYTINGNTITGKITVNSQDTDLAKIDYTFVISESKISLESELTLNNSSDSITVQFKYEIIGDNLDKKPTKYDFNGYLKLIEDSTDSNSDYITLNINGSTKYTDSTDIPDLGNSNGVCINTIADEELSIIKTDINTNLNTFTNKILEKFDMTRTNVGLPEENINFFEELEDFSTETTVTELDF